MLSANLLAKKRDGGALRDEEIRFLIDGFCNGSVADYQMSAFAMAVCLQGMTDQETATLTRAMLDSGDVLPRDVSGRTPRVDKHSTGGLGDKVSLILAPLLSACDVHVPMISGRGLGLSGGTLDKLEAIPGFRTDLSEIESAAVLRQTGAFIVSATERIAPADRRLYALRDVTGTVESIPLITASILSKKLAASLDALVMDVKVGGAAFMKTLDDARALADSIQRVGNAAGLPTAVLISDMDQPLGKAVGNAIEVNEAVAVLKGVQRSDLAIGTVRELTLELSATLLVNVSVAADRQDALTRLNQALDDGSAMERFLAMVAAQGGRWTGDLNVAPGHAIEAEHDGYVQHLDCHRIGSTVVSLGGGRRKLGDVIDPAVGISIEVRIGDRVQRGQRLLQLHCHDNQPTEYVKRLRDAVVISEAPVPARPLLFE
ncbi:Pyrimidine-nucleoside phosphorylase [Stieleria maiorica]|uniref:thymidine phosphorylase n=2 Tax=Stieleria maiorica TaxID=2795974 RepID=A0A5B9MKI5_9BACT|nr:Pyrimidine-nucleoside phosphorylase [Stieleria maiorica]